MTNNTATFDPAWDAIDATATEVAEFEGGKLYKQNALHLIVLNGTQTSNICVGQMKSQCIMTSCQRTEPSIAGAKFKA
jgi:hypothetical protein